MKALSGWLVKGAFTLAFSAAVPVCGQTFEWNFNGNGNWGDQARWGDGISGFPDAAGVTADFTNVNISAGRTITVNGDFTIGGLLMGDTDNTSAYSLNQTAGAGSVTFDNGLDAAQMKVVSGAASTAVRVDINLASSLEIANTNGNASFLDIGQNGGSYVIQSATAGLKYFTVTSESLYRVNVYSSIQDGAGQVAVVSDLFNIDSQGQALNLSAVNTFTGGLFINGNVQSINGYGNSALGGAGGAITFNGGKLTFGGTISAANATVDRLTTLNGFGGTIDTGSQTITWSGVMQGEAGLVKNGTGTLILGSENTYSGGTIINAGVLVITSVGVEGVGNTSLGLGPDGTMENAGGLILNGGTLRNTPSTTLHSSRAVTFNNAATFDTVGFLNVDSKVTGAGNIIKTGGSTLSFNNITNDFTGDLFVNSGILRVRNGDGSLGATDNTVTLAANTRFRVQFGTDQISFHEGRTLTLAGGSANDGYSFMDATDGNAQITWNGLIDGAGGLEKVGNGTVILTHDNTYAGGTRVTAGVFEVNNLIGSATGSGSVQVTGATLRGGGSISGGSTASITFGENSFLAVGLAGGAVAEDLHLQTASMAAAAISFDATTIFQFDLFNNLEDETSNDLLYLSTGTGGSIHLNGTLQIANANEDSLNWVLGDVWKLIDWTGITWTGEGLALDLLDVPELADGLVWEGYADATGYYVRVAAVPEPSRVFFLLMAGAWFFAGRRRR